MKELKKFLSKCGRAGLPGGPNEIKFSVEGYKSTSKDRFNPFNVIPSGDITMKGVPHPVFGEDNLGNGQMMYPGNDYKFPGDVVTEIPMQQAGGESGYITTEELAAIGHGMTLDEYRNYQAYADMNQRVKDDIVRTKLDNERVSRQSRPQWQEMGFESPDAYYEYLQENSLQEDVLNMYSNLLEFTGIPSAYRIYQDPIGTAKGIGNTAMDVFALNNPNTMALMMGTGKNPYTGNEAWSGVDKAMDALVFAPAIGKIGSLGKKAYTAGKTAFKASKYADDVARLAPSVDKLDDIRSAYHNSERLLQPSELQLLDEYGYGLRENYQISNQLPPPPSEIHLPGENVGFEQIRNNFTRGYNPPRPIEGVTTWSDVDNALITSRPAESSIDLRRVVGRIDETTSKSKPKPKVNKSGLTKEQALAASKDKDKISKMSEAEFENTVLKPDGELAPYKPGPEVEQLTFNPVTRRLKLKDAIELTDEEYVKIFNENLDLLNDIIAKNNKSGVHYRVKGLDKNGNLTFYTPEQTIAPKLTPAQKANVEAFTKDPKKWLIDKTGIKKVGDKWKMSDEAGGYEFNSLDEATKAVADELHNLYAPKKISGESVWDLELNPGMWRGDVENIMSEGYYRGIPGLEMHNTSSGVFADHVARKGTGAYESINQFLKQLDLGRVKPGFNIQTKYSKGAWENFINSGRGVGYYGKPGVVYGTMLRDGGMPIYDVDFLNTIGYIPNFQLGGQNLKRESTFVDLPVVDPVLRGVSKAPSRKSAITPSKSDPLNRRFKDKVDVDPSKYSPAESTYVKSPELYSEFPEFKIDPWMYSDHPRSSVNPMIYNREQGEFNEALDFHKKWMDSPQYKKMLLESISNEKAFLSDYDKLANYNMIKAGRKQNLKSMPGLNVFSHQLEEHPTYGGWSYSKTGLVEVFPKGYDVEGLYRHEASHSADKANPTTYEYFRKQSESDYMDNPSWRLIPASDVNLIQDTELKDNSLSKKWVNYVTEPTEVRARLNDIRGAALKSGLYNPFREEVTPEIYERLKEFEFETGEKSGFDPLEQLRDVYEDEDIIKFLNEISENKQKKNPATNQVMQYASEGGEVELKLMELKNNKQELEEWNKLWEDYLSDPGDIEYMTELLDSKPSYKIEKLEKEISKLEDKLNNNKSLGYMPLTPVGGNLFY